VLIEGTGRATYSKETENAAEEAPKKTQGRAEGKEGQAEISLKPRTFSENLEQRSDIACPYLKHVGEKVPARNLLVALASVRLFQ
jgi:hypothetical protein